MSEHAASPAAWSLAAFEHSHAGIVITDPEQRILWANPAFEKITGHAPHDVIGWDIHAFHHPEQDDDYHHQRHALAQSGHWQGEVLCQRRNGEHYPELLTIDSLYDEHHQPCGYVRIFVDISTMKAAQSHLQLKANHDPLTGLANRSLFDDHLQRALHHAQRHADEVALLFIDLDRFKPINDSLGHGAGDTLLKQVARRLSQALRSDDVLARFGGDEFLVLLQHEAGVDGAQTVALRLQEALEAPFKVGDRRLPISASIGIALFPRDGDSAEELLRSADSAMYSAKHAGGGGHAFVDPLLSQQLQRQLAIELALREAVADPDSAFHLAYQPQCDLVSGRVIGLEALLRWHSTQPGQPSPRDCILLARKLGLAVRLDRWVIGEVIAQRRAWQDIGSALAELPIAVNIVDDHLRGDATDRLPLDHFLRQHTSDASWLTLEIACDSLADEPESTQHLFRRLQRLGVSLALDELGDGHVNFAYLSRLPIRQAKVNGVLIKGIAQDPRSQALLGGIQRLLETLGVECIAVGVENEESASAVRHQGIHLAQGNHLAKPMAADELSAWYNPRR
ncbi:PAS domain S-box-containing protein/diguanylate cyclase (GGDEF) domain-containing protein [Franzmannia pantelleriensis]|uniref:PAS domain S-box-containing protein/diguanylate cyclase (GGDEF) domain-containing protein n=1 Tax=Franzmannia pantelleriensis TaxID=48727 RepID=A0A1G9GT78_9GAMM|nr:EAL domain-containing protein [Halomonas pantelleriensis]SDL03848.1 PAS domain S-box-containing protein/diguanylate cyclase (GGDEF) domain-containing protein [Halomonas pantelleriensis]